MKKVQRIKSLEKALSILDCFCESRPDWSVSELSRNLSIPKSTVVTLLATLEACGYVVQDQRTKNYHLGLRLFELGFVMRDDMKVRSYVLPILEELQQKTGEIVYLTIPRYGEVLYLESVYSTKRMVQHSMAGRLRPIHCTGVGKAMLAFMPNEYVEQIVKVKGLTRYTKTTITTLSALKQELEDIRNRGYAVDNGEHESNIHCVAVPIIGDQGITVGGVSVSGPHIRFNEDTIKLYAGQLMDAVSSIKRYANLLPHSSPVPFESNESNEVEDCL